ncbi:MAG: acyltransferase family protein [Aquabacterium sp.]
MSAQRTDIQVLRAIAVLAVLLFHFQMPGLTQGFLGVDMFLVISGYLMSKVIMEGLDRGDFRLSTFFLRRARRLLPAAWAMLLVSTLIAPWVLTPPALRDFVWQLAGALSFSANFVLWQQSGYFEQAAHLKPLLHTWSLALEEQYYFVLPLLLMVVAAKWRGLTLLALAALSAAACFTTYGIDPGATFYLLPTRAWELLIGSLCALPAVQAWAQGRSWRIDSLWLAGPILLSTLVWGWDTQHPRGDAVLVCLATACLVLRPSAILNSPHAWLRPASWVGDISYSLYLVHWPLLVFAQHIVLDGLQAPERVGLLVASFALAYLSHRYIEQPYRHTAQWCALWQSLRWPALALIAGAAIITWQLQQPAVQYWAKTLKPNYGFGAACEFESAYRLKPACTNNPDAPARTMIWGDSFAMHWVQALQASAPPGGIMQATRSICGPLLDMARQTAKDPRDRAQRCLAFNQSVLRYLQRTPEVRYVVLSSRWQYYLDDPVRDQAGQPMYPTPKDIAQSLTRTVAALRRAGKKVIILAPPPNLGSEIDISQCAERHALHLLTVSHELDAQCRFPESHRDTHQGAVRELLRLTAQQADVTVLDPSDVQCTEGLCQTAWQDVPLYRDAGHLSQEGSATLGRIMDLGMRIQRDAH